MIDRVSLGVRDLAVSQASYAAVIALGCPPWYQLWAADHIAWSMVEVLSTPGIYGGQITSAIVDQPMTATDAVDGIHHPA